MRFLYCFFFVFSLFSGELSKAQNVDLLNNKQELLGLSLEELLAVNVSSTSLTGVREDLTPLPITIITAEDIELSGARNLDELLEIYVPTFFMLHKGSVGHVIGARGIISNQNDKVLLLVNGKIMNARYETGVYSERLMTMLGDIDRIEVIESPQSSLYGPGGISLIINIYIKSATEEGIINEVSVQNGHIDRYHTVQVRHSNKVSNDLNYTAYYGVDKADGVSQERSPLRFSFNGSYYNQRDTILTDENVGFRIPNLNASNTRLRHKAHAELNYKDFNTWFRYTQGGIGWIGPQARFIRRPDLQADNKFGYRHMTFQGNYQKQMNDDFSFMLMSSFDRLRNEVYKEREFATTDTEENEIFYKMLLTYNKKKFGFAVGTETSIETFKNFRDSTEWTTEAVAAVGELQYQFSKKLSIVSGVRLDKHSYTNAFYSPKLAVVWKPSVDDFVRFQYSRSTRRSNDCELRRQVIEDLDREEGTETVDFLELSGDFELMKGLAISPNAFYSDYHIIAWNPSIRRVNKVGNLTYYGFGVTGTYVGGGHDLKLSHQLTKPLDLVFEDPETYTSNNVTTSPYGYGNSFQNYPDHLSKVVYRYSISDWLTLTSSLQVIWRMEGAEQAAEYNRDVLGDVHGNVISDSSVPFESSAYLHLGCVVKDLLEGLSASIFAYNVLGMFDENLNKRVEFQRTSQYRIQPTSFSVKLSYEF